MKRSSLVSVKPKVSIIIASFNTRDIVLKCLRLISEDDLLPPSEVIVVDNASTDGSVSAIRKRFPGVRVLENNVNMGLAAADDRGLRVATGEFVMLLNTDAFVSRGAISKLVGYLEVHSGVGAVVPRLLNNDGSIQASCFPDVNVAGTFFAYWCDQKQRVEKYYPKGEVPVMVDFVVVSAIVIRRKLLVDLGGEDERYFLYFQDLDLCRRVRKLGWKIAYLPAAMVTHLHGASGRPEGHFGYLRESLLYPFKRISGSWEAGSSQARIVEDSIRYFGWLRHLLMTLIIKFSPR